MSKSLKKTVFLQFTDGLVRYCNLIEMKDGSIKVSLIGESYEWTVHPDQTHMKKLHRETWVEPPQHQMKEYEYINRADMKSFRGAGGLVMPLYVNGIPLTQETPNPDDAIMIVEHSSSERTWLYVGVMNGEQKLLEENMTVNDISPYIVVPFPLLSIVVGIHNAKVS